MQTETLVASSETMQKALKSSLVLHSQAQKALVWALQTSNWVHQLTARAILVVLSVATTAKSPHKSAILSTSATLVATAQAPHHHSSNVLAVSSATLAPTETSSLKLTMTQASSIWVLLATQAIGQHIKNTLVVSLVHHMVQSTSMAISPTRVTSTAIATLVVLSV